MFAAFFIYRAPFHYLVPAMLSVRIIPCLDVHDGRVVKGVNFVNLIDAGDPVEQAKAYEQQGADELVFLDITASSDERNTMIDVVKRTADHCFMPLTVGGGLRNVENDSRHAQRQVPTRSASTLLRFSTPTSSTRPPLNSATNASSSQSTPNVYQAKTAGKFTHTADATTQAWTP